MTEIFKSGVSEIGKKTQSSLNRLNLESEDAFAAKKRLGVFLAK